jgi:TPR repeat protein
MGQSLRRFAPLTDRVPLILKEDPMRAWAAMVFVAWISFSTSTAAQCDLLEEGVEVTAAEVSQLAQMAEQGHPVAQNVLGFAYYHGCVVERDHPEAARWFGLAAEQG